MNETLKRAAELLRQDCLREVGSDEVSQVATKLEALAAQMGESVQEAQSEALKADAARYRWLIARRDKTSPEILSMWARVNFDARNFPTVDEWNNAIDAAIAKEQP